MKAAVVVILLAAALLVPSANGSFPGGITFTAVREKARNYSRAPEGHTGDLIVSGWRLNDRDGRAIGYAEFSCRWITEFSRLCYGEYRLPKGSFVVGGTATTIFNAELAVLGGTGFYAGIKGVAKHNGVGNHRSQVFVYLV